MTGTERKVFQKYYPPDFDPTKLPRAKQPKNRQWVQRVMTPFNMRCNTCNEYIYKGKKFNMKREPADEFYLGIRIWRFYFRCPNCLAEISFKTDLENCDYQAENGATRLFEAFKLWKDQEKLKEAKEEEDKNDPMKQLEKRTKMSRAEMEAMGKLEEIQEVNRRHEGAAKAIDQFLDGTEEKMSMRDFIKRQEEADDFLVRQLFCKTEDGRVEKRIKDEDYDDEEDFNQPGTSRSLLSADVKDVKRIPKLEQTDAVKKRMADQKSLLAKLVVPKRAKKAVKEEPPDEDDCGSGDAAGPSTSGADASRSGQPGPGPGPSSSAAAAAPSGLAGLADYGSGSDSD